MDRSGLILIGPSGVGKTHLVVAAIKALAQKGMRSLFCYYGELLKKIQNSYNPQSQITELEILKPIFDADILVLDDLGVVKPTEWVWDAVSIILNTRYNDNRTTLITSNIEDGPAKKSGTTAVQFATRMDTLGDRIGERMRSRLFEMCRLVSVDGKDYREKMRKAR
jgi:DNA replication protein DnaC